MIWLMPHRKERVAKLFQASLTSRAWQILPESSRQFNCQHFIVTVATARHVIFEIFQLTAFHII
jgi:hypothetical protein